MEDLKRKIAAPICGESCKKSYWLLLEVLANEKSTREMIRDAVKRHARVINLHDRRAA